jgi:DNA-binding transcriptional LysR family regulator
MAGLAFIVLPDYLCEDGVNSNALKLILKLTKAVTNQICLVYRKSDRHSLGIELLLNMLMPI